MAQGEMAAGQQTSFILRDVQTGQEYPVLPGGLHIGRTSQNDVTLHDEKVSRDHATLWIQEGQLYIRDEDSTNGTWVNGERIADSRALQSGDRVRIGDTRFEVAAGRAPSVPVAGGVSPDREAAPAQPSSVPVVPIAIAGGVVAVILGALMIRSLRGAVQPTETPTVTLTPEMTATSTVTSTATATSIPTETPTRAVSPAPRATEPELVSPEQGGEYANPITFQWSGSLSGNQAYQVTAYHLGSGHTVQSNLLMTEEWSTSLPAERYGEWRWTVSVMQNGKAVASSPEWMFWFQPYPGSDDGDGNGGVSPTDTPEFRS